MIASTTIQCVVVNPAFLQEIKDSNPELWQTVHQLRQLCQSKESPAAIAHRLVRLLDELRDFLSLQFALEESYGYLELPGGATASVASEMAARARGEHCGLYLQLSDLAERAEEVQYRGVFREQLPMLIEAAKAFDQKLRDHETLECELIESSFDLPCHNPLTGSFTRLNTLAKS